jgi:hypothetical protein
MKIKLFQFLLKIVVVFSFAEWNLNAQAGQPGITGNIGFTGSITINGSSIATATAITGFVNPEIFYPSGNYTNISNFTPINLTPFAFNPLTPIIPLWTYTNNGIIYRFNFLSTTSFSQIQFNNKGFLDLSGVGIVHITGFADTPADFSFSSQDPYSSQYNGQPAYTFSASLNCAATNIPAINVVNQTYGQIILKWNTISGLPYQVQSTTNLFQTNWSNFGSAIITSNSTAFFTNSIGTNSSQFYRVIIPD